MATVNSGAAAYCTAAQFLRYHDARTVGDLIQDQGQRVDATNILTNEILLTALKRAAGDIEMACTVGERYQPDDLQTLVYGDLDDLTQVACEYDYSTRTVTNASNLSAGDFVHLTDLTTALPDGIYVVASVAAGSFTIVDDPATTSDSEGFWAKLKFSGTVGAQALAGLNADLAFWHLYKRRHHGAKLDEVAGAVQAQETLQALRLGEAVFSLQEQQEAAGQMTIVENALDSTEDLKRVSRVAERMFGNRSRFFSG